MSELPDEVGGAAVTPIAQDPIVCEALAAEASIGCCAALSRVVLGRCWRGSMPPADTIGPERSGARPLISTAVWVNTGEHPRLDPLAVTVFPEAHKSAVVRKDLRT